MRKIITGIVLVLLMLAIFPWINGFLFKKNFFHAIEVVNQDKRLAIDVLTYHQGWFTSQALIRITLINRNLNQLQQIGVQPLKLTVPTSFIVEEKIYHGPILHSFGKPYFQFGFARLHSYFLNNHQNSGMLRIDIFSGFNGDWHGHFSIAPFSFSLPTINKFSMEKSMGSFAILLNKNNLDHIQMDMLTGAILIEGDPKNVSFKQLVSQPIKVKYDAVHEANGLWSGNSSLYTSEMIITRTDNTNFNFNKLAINSTFSVGENIFYNTNLSIFIKNFFSPNNTIPVFSNLKINFLAKNFSVRGLSDYINFMKSKTPNEIKNIDIKTIESLLAHTISPASILKGYISSDTSLGSFSSHSKTIWPANTSLPNTINDISNHSLTTINIRMSQLLVVKLLTIYGNQIMATSDIQKKESQKTGQLIANEYFQKQPASNRTALQQIVAQLLKAGAITIPESLQILSMEKHNQSLKTFSLNIGELNLSPDINNKLILSYQQQVENAQRSNVDPKISQLIEDLVAVSYMKKDKEAYISTITIENGMLKINGSPIFSEAPKTSSTETKP